MMSGPWNGPAYQQPLRGAPNGGFPLPPGMNYGGPAHGPVSDPGSWARSSLQTARGYDQANLRGFVGSYRGLMEGGPGLQQLNQSMSKMRSSAVGLGASIYALNRSFEEGSGFDDPVIQGAAGLSTVVSGGKFLNSSVSTVRNVARTGRYMAGAAARRLGPGIAGRAAVGAGGMLGSVGAASGAAIAAPFAAAAALGGALYYYNRKNDRAIEEGESLDERISIAQSQGRMGDIAENGIAQMRVGADVERASGKYGNEMDRISGVMGLMSSQSMRAFREGRGGDAERIQGGIASMAARADRGTSNYVAGLHSQDAKLGSQRTELERQYNQALQKQGTSDSYTWGWKGGVHETNQGKGGSKEDVRALEQAKQIAQQIADIDRQRAGLGKEIAAATQQNLQALMSSKQAEAQLVQAQMGQARGARDGMGRMSDRQWGRAMSAYDSAMKDGKLTDREAMRLEKLGLGNSQAVEKFWENTNQSRIDDAKTNGRGGALGEGAATTKEMAALTAKLVAAETAQADLLSKISEAKDRQVDVMANLAVSTEALLKRITTIEQRLAGANAPK
jgi:hypothetical protein